MGKEPHHELRVRPRKKDLRSACFAPHVVNIGADAISCTEGFTRNHLIAAYNALGASKIDNHRTKFNPFDRAVYDLANTIFIFLVMALTFRVANLLNNNLLSGLRCNA